MPATILIIGCTGLVGRPLARMLHGEGRQVSGIARSAIAADAGFPQRACDLGEVDSYRDWLESADTILYAAGNTIPGDTPRGPLYEFTGNLDPFCRFLDALQCLEPKHLIYISSGGAVYGRARTTPIPEQHRVFPVSYYGAGKVSMEAFLQVLAYQSQHRVTILRPSNIYGTGLADREGFGLIDTVLNKLATDSPLEIWGDGRISRDFLHIDDFCSACSAVVDWQCDSPLNTLNVGFGEAHSINAVCDAAEKAAGKTLTRIYAENRSSDPQQICLDISRIRESTGWNPAVPLEEGIRRAWSSMTSDSTRT